MADDPPPPLDYATPPWPDRQPVVQADAINRRTQVEAARTYLLLRRRSWRLMGQLIALLAATAVPQLFRTVVGEVASGLLSAPFAGCLICCVRAVDVLGALAGLECPRCARLLGASRYLGSDHDACKHCGLDLGPAVAAAGW